MLQCVIEPGLYGTPSLVHLIEKLPNYEILFRGVQRAGVRYWRLQTRASLTGGSITYLDVDLYCAGRYETLGTKWAIATGVIPFAYREPVPEYAGRNSLRQWYHITSIPPGEGYRISVTPRSTEAELRARRINRRCFISVRGCTSLCALLPEAQQLRHPDGTCVSGCLRQPVW